MMFNATKAKVKNRGSAPDSVLKEFVEWMRVAPDDISAPRKNINPGGADPDVFAQILYPMFGPWENLIHRKAAFLELMRVHAGFESSWNWKEGVDTTNWTSMTHKEGQETGLFQVSFDSTRIHDHYMLPFAEAHGVGTADTFIPAMKKDHPLCMEYYCRLVRVNFRWAGPLLRHEVEQYMHKDAVEEFRVLLG